MARLVPMTFDIDKIAASKEARRRRLAALPFKDKLRILDQMRERDLLFQRARLVDKQSRKT